MTVYQTKQHPRALNDTTIAEMALRRHKAETEVSQLCGGHHAFRMSIPVDENDSDMILTDALGDSQRLEGEVYRLRGMLRTLYVNNFGTIPDGIRDGIEAILWGTGDEIKGDDV